MNTLIIGCGAAGAAAAIAAAQRGDDVTVIDRNRKPLKKLGVTGNGRGNLMNAGALRYYGDEAFALEVLTHCTPKTVADFLEDCGIVLSEEDEGRVYPAANLASVAVDGLLQRLRQLRVKLIPCAGAEAIQRTETGFSVTVMVTEYAPDQVKASGKVKKGEALAQRSMTLLADRVIVAPGGAAAPAHGTDGTAYALLTSLGHTLRTPKPALCALLTEGSPLKGLSGKRVRAKLSLRAQDGTTLHESNGEALFADDGVSGIAAMQLARFVQPGCTLHMNMRQTLMGREDADAAQWLESRAQRLAGQAGSGRVTLADVLTGSAYPALQGALLRMANLRDNDAATPENLRKLAQVMTDYALSVTGTRDFDQAQVTAGGLDPAQFDPRTMESKLVPGLYAAGEILDVDGDCGGYNLMFAFAGGLLAGRG